MAGHTHTLDSCGLGSMLTPICLQMKWNLFISVTSMTSPEHFLSSICHFNNQKQRQDLENRSENNRSHVNQPAAANMTPSLQSWEDEEVSFHQQWRPELDCFRCGRASERSEVSEPTWFFLLWRTVSQPVRKEGADEVFGVPRHLHVIREDKGVLVVHDLAVSSHQGFSVERSFTCADTHRFKEAKRDFVTWSISCWLLLIPVGHSPHEVSHLQTTRIWRLPRTTSHTHGHSNHHHPGTAAPRGRCSRACRRLCHNAPCLSSDKRTNTQWNGIRLLLHCVIYKQHFIFVFTGWFNIYLLNQFHF